MLAVFGSPIEHSLSPYIHQAFASQHGFKLNYVKIEANSENFIYKLNNFRKKVSIGANITYPLKNIAYSACQEFSEQARKLEAANTLSWKNNKLIAHNTDGDGFVNDLKSKQIEITNSKIIIIGAGAAAKSIAYSLMKEAPKELFIMNRTKNKAKKLASALDIGYLTEQEIAKKEFNILINASAAGLFAECPLSLTQDLSNTVCYDLSYGGLAKFFVNYCKNNNVREVYTGEGMLVEQAALSFNIWFNKSVETNIIKKSLIENIISD